MINKRYNLFVSTITAVITMKENFKNNGNNVSIKDAFTDSIYYKEPIQKIKKIYKNSKETKTFNNCECLYLEIEESHNICIKIFKNNTIQVSGLKSIEHIHTIQNIIKKKCNAETDFSISMINCCIRTESLLKQKYNLLEVKNLLNSQKNCDTFMAIYQPTNYHGLKVRHSNGTKMLVFGSGSICVISNSFDNIYETIDNFFNTVE